jgi:endonuclease G
VFENAIDLWADDVQIPSSFFKIIIWQGAAGLKAVCLIVDQLALLSETRFNPGSPHAARSLNVSQWRVPVTTIERRSRLDFGAAVRAADTINAAAQPVVGGEAGQRITSFEDILPPEAKGVGGGR